MNNSIISIVGLSFLKSAIILMAGLAIFSSCKKAKDDTTTTPSTDITYEAALFKLIVLETVLFDKLITETWFETPFTT